MKSKLKKIPEFAKNVLLARMCEVFEFGSKITFEEFITKISVFSEKASKQDKMKCKFVYLIFAKHEHLQLHLKFMTWIMILLLIVVT